MHKRTISLLLCFAALVVAAGPQVARGDNLVDFEVFRVDMDGDGTADLYAAEIFVEVFGATAVELLPQSGGTVPFDMWGPEFSLETPDLASLALLNAEIGGTHKLRITHPGGVSDYQYTMATITDGIFPNLPTLGAVPADIPQNFNFQWAWAGSADEMFAEAELFSGWYKEEESFGGSFVVGTTTDWTPDFTPQTGSGEFYVAYANVGNVATGNGLVVSNWLLISGPDVMGGAFDEVFDFADSVDVAFFNVVPEPATMTMLAAGGLAMIRRRRKK